MNGPSDDYESGNARLTQGLVKVALEALSDPDFYDRLRDDPRGAAASAGIDLSDTDVSYLENEVHWAVLDAHIDELRDAMHLTAARAAPLW